MAGTLNSEEGLNSSPWVSVLNLCNAAIGAGVLSFPYAFRLTGVVGGVMLTSLAWLVAAGSLCLLVQAAEQYKSKTYQQLVLTIFGRGMAIITSLAMLFLLLGAMISYLIITGDAFGPMFATILGETSPLADRRLAIILFALVLILPLSFKRSLKELKWSSMLTVLMLTYLTVILVVTGIRHLCRTGISPNVRLFQIDVRTFITIDIVMFAYNCHIQVVPIFFELSDHPDPLFKTAQSEVLKVKLLRPMVSDEPQLSTKRSKRLQRMYEVIFISTLICFSGFCLVGIFGYLMFPNVESDILVALGTTNVFMYLARIGMSLVAMVCFPVQNLPARAIVDDAITHVFRINTQLFSRTRHTILTLLIFGGTLGTALIVTDLGMVFSILGATGSVVVIFIIPGQILLHTPFKRITFHYPDNEAGSPTIILMEIQDPNICETLRKNWMGVLGGAFLVISGVIIFFVTVYVTVSGLGKS